MAKPAAATARLTPAEAYKLHIATVRRNAAIERQRQDYQADIARVQALYKEGSKRRLQAPAAPAVKEPEAYTVTRLPGGAKASKRQLDMSPEAVARREKRRQQRAARKAKREAAAAI